MASFQQVNYCKTCKTNVSLNEKGQCKKCLGTSLNKSWSIRFRYVNQEQKEIQKRLSGYSTKKEANEAYIKFMATAKQYKKNINLSQTISFEEMTQEYIQFTKSRIKESAFISMNSRISNHITPYFKNFQVSKIEPLDILTWQKSIVKYSASYQKDIRRYLSAILNFAEKYYKIPNQARNVDVIRVPKKKKEMKIWTPEQFAIFIDNIQKFEHKTFFQTLYTSGARLGEILALTWNDINLDKGIISINKNLTRKTLSKSYAITTPKTESSYRDIYMPKQVINNLKQLKVLEDEINMSAFVFYGEKPLSSTTLTRIKDNAIVKINKNCNDTLPKIRLHDFRHSHASLLISSGISIVGVSKRLGHSNIEQTLNTYSHLMPKEEDKIISTLNNIF